MYQSEAWVQTSSFNNKETHSFMKKKKFLSPYLPRKSPAFHAPFALGVSWELLKYTCVVINSLSGNRVTLKVDR